MRINPIHHRRTFYWLLPLLLLLGEGPAPDTVKDFPDASWAVTRYSAIQDCAMAKDVSRVLAIEPDALHVFDPTGRETVSIGLPFTEVAGFWAPADASFALVVGWEGEASRAMAVNAEGKTLFSNAFSAEGQAYYERGAVATSGAEFALLISGAGSENGASDETPAADQFSIQVYSKSGEKLWESAPFEGGPASGLWVSDRVVEAAGRVWRWRESPNAAPVSLPSDEDIYGLLPGDRVATGGYDGDGEEAVFVYSDEGRQLSAARIMLLPAEVDPAANGSLLFSDGHGYKLVGPDGSVIWKHELSHPIQHHSMDVSNDGRFVAVSYYVSPFFRPAPQSMQEFEVSRFGTEFYVFDVWSGEPRWSLLASNPLLTRIRVSARGDNWILCGENEIQAYHFHQGPVSYARGLLRNIVRFIAKPWQPESGGAGNH